MAGAPILLGAVPIGIAFLCFRGVIKESEKIRKLNQLDKSLEDGGEPGAVLAEVMAALGGKQRRGDTQKKQERLYRTPKYQ